MNFNIMQLIGKKVIVRLSHVVYGNQKLYIRYFEPFCSDNTIGFTTNGHAIYLYKTEIQHIESNEKSVKIVSDDQTMTIKFV